MVQKDHTFKDVLCKCSGFKWVTYCSNRIDFRLFEFCPPLHVSSIKLKLFSDCFPIPILGSNFHKTSMSKLKENVDAFSWTYKIEA